MAAYKKDAPVPEENGENETVAVNKADYEKLKEQAQKAQDHWDTILRQQADFENLRKRLERDKQEFQKFAHEDIVADLLGILDDLERSVEAAEMGQENFEAFLKGIEMILAHLFELLKRKGVVPIEAQGKNFDPHEHEALMQTETRDHEDGEVIEELQKGYKIGDRVIRTAKVRVAKKIEEKEKDKQAP
jgi:molecular chaperone GrpE